jgi:hypothetical protein
MKNKISPLIWRIVFGLILSAGLLAGALLSPPAWADSGLPPRDVPTPGPNNDDKGGSGGQLVGAHLELHAPGAPAGAWAAVQWQDSVGGWHDVEGWRGAVAGSSRWWVHPKDFGSGPFRWSVKQGSSGSQWAVSSSFNLPGQPNETQQVTVSR